MFQTTNQIRFVISTTREAFAACQIPSSAADLVKQQWLGSKSNSNHLPNAISLREGLCLHTRKNHMVLTCEDQFHVKCCDFDPIPIMSMLGWYLYPRI